MHVFMSWQLSEPELATCWKNTLRFTRAQKGAAQVGGSREQATVSERSLNEAVV